MPETLDYSSLSQDQKLAAIAELSSHVSQPRRDKIFSVLQNRTRHITLVLEDIYQSHNAAAVVRTCEALGIQDLHIIELRNQLNLSKTTVAKGATKWLDFTYYNNEGEKNTMNCINNLKSLGYKVAATALEADSVDLDNIPLDQPLAVMIGTEMTGLTESAKQNANFSIKLPMYGFTQSYNLSVTAAILLNSLTTRLRKSNINWQIPEDQRDKLAFEWLHKCVTGADRILEKLF